MMLLINPNYSAPSKNQIFRNFFLNSSYVRDCEQFTKKISFFVKTPKNNFSDTQSKNPNKTRGKHFHLSVPQKNPPKLTIPYKMVSLLRYFAYMIYVFQYTTL